jgi:hypothetical protein
VRNLLRSYKSFNTYAQVLQCALHIRLPVASQLQP